MKYQKINLRLCGMGRSYYEHTFQKFADLFDEKQIKEVQFGKQDIRGAHSITLIDHESCIPMQKFFETREELLGYVQGVVATSYPYMDLLDSFKKEPLKE